MRDLNEEVVEVEVDAKSAQGSEISSITDAAGRASNVCCQTTISCGQFRAANWGSIFTKLGKNIVFDTVPILLSAVSDFALTVLSAGNLRSRLTAQALRRAAGRWEMDVSQDVDGREIISPNIGYGEYGERVYHPFVARMIPVAVAVQLALLWHFTKMAKHSVRPVDEIYSDGTAKFMYQQQGAAINATYAAYQDAAGMALGDVLDAGGWNVALMCINACYILLGAGFSIQEHANLRQALSAENHGADQEQPLSHTYNTIFRRITRHSDGSLNGWNIGAMSLFVAQIVVLSTSSAQANLLRQVVESNPTFAMLIYPSKLGSWLENDPRFADLPMQLAMALGVDQPTLDNGVIAGMMQVLIAAYTQSRDKAFGFPVVIATAGSMVALVTTQIMKCLEQPGVQVEYEDDVAYEDDNEGTEQGSAQFLPNDAVLVDLEKDRRGEDFDLIQTMTSIRGRAVEEGRLRNEYEKTEGRLTALQEKGVSAFQGTETEQREFQTLLAEKSEIGERLERIHQEFAEQSNELEVYQRSIVTAQPVVEIRQASEPHHSQQQTIRPVQPTWFGGLFGAGAEAAARHLFDRQEEERPLLIRDHQPS